MELKCFHCGNEWDYTGKNKFYASCSHCLRKVKVIGDKREFKKLMASEKKRNENIDKVDINQAIEWWTNILSIEEKRSMIPKGWSYIGNKSKSGMAKRRRKLMELYLNYRK